MQKQNRLLLIALLSTARAEREVLQGVCDEGQCKELSLLPGVWNLDRHDCNDAHLNDSYRDPGHYEPRHLHDPPECVIWKLYCQDYQCGACKNTSQELQPHLTFTLEHYNSERFGVTLSWEQPAEVTGYVLLMTDEPRSGRCGGKGTADLHWCKCMHITNPNTTTHTYARYYRGQTAQTLHVKLIPLPWCDGPSIAIHIPETCHNIRPGDCDICGAQSPMLISPPTNVRLRPLPLLRGVFLSWEPGETYYGLPYPNIYFYLQIHDVVNGSEATPRLQVVGRTNVTLRNFDLHTNYSVQIRAHDCGCGESLSLPLYFYITTSDYTPGSGARTELQPSPIPTALGNEELDPTRISTSGSGVDPTRISTSGSEENNKVISLLVLAAGPVLFVISTLVCIP